ncbi:hypothetical protein QYE76_057658 [Lolium multiflorum]|uniref:F-box domain-containing protein n=1 Tax=Lolium multiflorum TaxID=4521 RepID=A0AAD8T4M1_LOLMU|nr:hypothetical protein QYE76_057658 [Lolium multiflorum]
MNDVETGPPPPASRRKAPYMSHELVWEILSRLPVKSLVRFSLVCKTWRATISRDASFHRAHLRRQKPWLLISPHTQEEYWRDDAPLHTDKVGLYRWEAHQEGTTAPLVHATGLSSDDLMHGFAHCDGLVLLPSDAAVHVLNPATHRTLTLPWSPGADRPPRKGNKEPYTFSHQAFGLGYDTHSNTYKVARFFYRSVYACAIGGYHYTTEGALVEDIMREGSGPRLHGTFIRLRNGEVALNRLAKVALLGGDKSIEADQELRLRERLAVLEIELLAGASERRDAATS